MRCEKQKWRGGGERGGVGGGVWWFFFFQAEDGRRDRLVTGVQTCALPICLASNKANEREAIDETMHNLRAIVEETGVMMLVIDRKSVV